MSASVDLRAKVAILIPGFAISAPWCFKKCHESPVHKTDPQCIFLMCGRKNQNDGFLSETMFSSLPKPSGSHNPCKLGWSLTSHCRDGAQTGAGGDCGVSKNKTVVDGSQKRSKVPHLPYPWRQAWGLEGKVKKTFAKSNTNIYLKRRHSRVFSCIASILLCDSGNGIRTLFCLGVDARPANMRNRMCIAE